MEVTELVEIEDFKQYYSLLRRGTYLLSRRDCAVIGHPVLPDEQPIGFFSEKDMDLYDRSGKFTMIFKNQINSIDKANILFLPINLKQLDIDFSTLGTSFYLMFGGKLEPMYHIDALSDYLGKKVYRANNSSVIPKYFSSEKHLREMGVEIIEGEYEALKFVGPTDEFERLYDCRPYLEREGKQFTDADKFDEIFFDNEVIKQFDEIHHSAIKIYLTMKLLEVRTERAQFTKEEIAKAASISMSTLERNMKELTKRSIVVSSNSIAKKMGAKKHLRINDYSSVKGFTKLSKPLVKHMIIELEPSEIALYVYFMYQVKSMNKTMISTSQINIALETGLNQSTVSEITDRLEQKGYIRKRTVMGEQNRKKTTYILRNN